MNPDQVSNRRPGWGWFIAGGCVLVLLLALLSPRSSDQNAAPAVSGDAEKHDAAISPPSPWVARSQARTRPATAGGPQTAEEIVARKLNQFSRGRRELVHVMAGRFNVEVPAEVERFFDAVEAGDWEEAKALFDRLRERRQSESESAKLNRIWSPILETLGVAEAVQDWPAQTLLDYGNAILGSLRPGMIYVGGTDPGRFIPTLLNETSDGERHVVLTQNALADSTYLEYLDVLYNGRVSTLTKDDSQRAFQDYLAGAQKRLEHDQNFPDEPKQIRPGEDIRVIDNRIQVSGQVAVMAISENLLRMFMEKNSGASFAIEQSFAFTAMYDETRPLGPIMELGVRDEQNLLTRERAAQSADYWRHAAQQLLSDAAAAGDNDVRLAYGKMAAEQAALLQHHGHRAEAEQAYRVATEIAPASPEAVYRYVGILVEQKRFDEAFQVTQNAVSAGGEHEQQFRRLVEELNRMQAQ